MYSNRVIVLFIRERTVLKTEDWNDLIDTGYVTKIDFLVFLDLMYIQTRISCIDYKDWQTKKRYCVKIHH